MKGWYDLMGLRMQQHPDALNVLTTFLKMVEKNGRPKRIMEIGTGSGGLAVMLAVYCHLESIPFHTIDIEQSRTHEILYKLGADVSVADIWQDPSFTRWKYLAGKPGRTILFCDGGNKKQEVISFSRVMKTGDFILAHDYASSHSDPGPLEWSHREIIDSHVEGCPIVALWKKYPTDQLFQELRRVAWGCWMVYP